MRRLATRFRGILRSKNAAKLGVWLTDVHQSGLYAMQRFARTLRRDIDAMRNAIAESRGNGQTEGQINRSRLLSGQRMAGLAQNFYVRECCHYRRLRNRN